MPRICSTSGRPGSRFLTWEIRRKAIFGRSIFGLRSRDDRLMVGSDMFCSSLRAIQVVCILGAVLFVKIGRASAQDSSHDVASDPHAVQPERPTVATHAHTVAPGWLEIEAGIERDKLDTSISFPTPILFKLGLTDRMQLGFFIPHITWHNKLDIGDFGLNLKWRLLDDAPLLGDFALLPSVKFPTSYSSNGGQGTFDASLVAISSHDLS